MDYATKATLDRLQRKNDLMARVTKVVQSYTPTAYQELYTAWNEEQSSLRKRLQDMNEELAFLEDCDPGHYGKHKCRTCGVWGCSSGHGGRD